MTFDEIYKWCSVQDINDGKIQIPEEIFLALDEESSRTVAEYFNNNVLIKLPEREIKFFEWVKTEDPEVWNDLWKHPCQEPYLVGIIFLPLLIDKLMGFPICDLITTDNYYFTNEHIVDKEAELFTESVRQRFLDKGKLTTSQALMMQISIQPTDIWHFAYNFSIELQKAKETVNQLTADKMLIHITQANHLAPFIKF